MEEAGEENDRPYNLRQRKTVQRYEAPPIGSCFAHLFVFSLFEHLFGTFRGLLCDGKLFYSPPQSL